MRGYLQYRPLRFPLNNPSDEASAVVVQMDWYLHAAVVFVAELASVLAAKLIGMSRYVSNVSTKRERRRERGV